LKTAAQRGLQSASSFQYEDRELRLYMYEADVMNSVQYLCFNHP